MMNFVQPRKIPSPTGHMVEPKIVNKKVGTKTIVEAHWIDPANGVPFHRGVVEIIDNAPIEEKMSISTADDAPYEVPQAKKTQYPHHEDSYWDPEANLAKDSDEDEEEEGHVAEMFTANDAAASMRVRDHKRSKKYDQASASIRKKRASESEEDDDDDEEEEAAVGSFEDFAARSAAIAKMIMTSPM